MTLLKPALLGTAALSLAAGAAFATQPPASAASDVQVVNIDCELHPRKVAIQNRGNTAQDLTGWRLMSNKPNEEFDLGLARSLAPGGPLAPGEIIFIFNGHGNPQKEPYQSGGSWVYSWEWRDFLDESAFVLTLDGTDFIRLVDASNFPWRDVSHMPCPDNTTAIPPLEQPATPTPPPSNPDPGAGGNTGQTDGNQATSAQTDGAQSTAGSQNVPAANTAASSGAGTAAQTGNVSGQAAGGPASGVGALQLQVAGGQPLGSHLLPLSFLGVLAAAALALVGVRMMRRALRRP